MSDNMIPLAVLAAELSEDVNMLARRLGSSVHLDNIGLRFVTRADAAQLIAERREAERDTLARVTAIADSGSAHADRERVRAIRRAQERSGLQLDGLSLSDAAHASITAEHHAARLSRAGETLDEMMRPDAMQYHPIEKEQ